MGYVNIALAALLFPICVVTVIGTLFLYMTRILLDTSFYRKSIKEKINFFFYFSVNVILWTISRISEKKIILSLFILFIILAIPFWNDLLFVVSCMLGVILSILFSIRNMFFLEELYGKPSSFKLGDYFHL
jgi:hypothetical protein